MTSVAVQPFAGTYLALPEPSSFAFAVRHSGVFWYRGSLSDVAATLSGDGDALALITSGDVDAERLSALVKDARDAAGAVPPQQAEIRVWSVLTVDVVDGRIQTVRVVRNPDKLSHL